MFNNFKFWVMTLSLSLFIFLPNFSYAWDNDHGHDEGYIRHEQGFHRHYYPQLTLVSGMDNIDDRVLIASGPVPSADDADVVQEVAAPDTSENY